MTTIRTKFVPFEMLNMTVSYLDTEDLLSLREVSKVMAKAAATQLFKNVTVWLQKKNLEQFLALSKLPDIKEEVQSITICDEFCGMECLTIDDFIHAVWLNAVYNPFQMKRRYGTPVWVFTSARRGLVKMDKHLPDEDAVAAFPESNIPEELRDDGWNKQNAVERYQSYIEAFLENLDLLPQEQEVDTMAATLQNFPNLRKVTIIGSNSSTRRGQWRGLFRRTTHLEFAHKSVIESGRQLDVLLQAVTKSNLGSKIKELEIEDNFFYGTEYGSADDIPYIGMRPETFLAAAPGLSNLSKVTMPLTSDFKAPEGQPPHLPCSDYILSLPSLQDVSILAPSRGYPFTPIPCPLIISNGLRSFDIQGGMFKLTELLPFLARQPELKKIKLSNPILDQGHYETLFSYLRNNMDITELQLEGELREKWSRDFTDHGTELDEALDERRRNAKNGIVDFVTHKSSTYPSDLVDHDTIQEPVFSDPSTDLTGYSTVLYIGKNLDPPPEEEDLQVAGHDDDGNDDGAGEGGDGEVKGEVTREETDEQGGVQTVDNEAGEEIIENEAVEESAENEGGQPDASIEHEIEDGSDNVSEYSTAWDREQQELLDELEEEHHRLAGRLSTIAYEPLYSSLWG